MKNVIAIVSSVPATIIGGVFLVVSFVLSKVGLSLPVDPAWVTVIISGMPLVYLAVRRILHNKGISKISSALLISIAMIAAIVIGDLFAAGEVAFIIALGEILEDMTTQRARKGLKDLLSLAPVQARRLTDGREETVDATAVVKDDILRVLAGETIPADGIIVSGDTSVDQSVMTGESLPVDKTVGDAVFCGTLNCFGAVDVRVTKTGKDSSLQTLIRMVKEAEEKKAPTARIADKWASWLVPAALLVAMITGIVTRDITRAVTVLVVFCPCALVLATPTAIMAAIGQATKHGVIIKSGEALEKMGRVDTVAFDKTGTLTVGMPAVSDCVVFADAYDGDTLLAVTAAAESKSEHPLGKAIVSAAREKEMDIAESTAFKMTVGGGVDAQINGCRVLCGNVPWLAENGVKVPENETVQCLRNDGKALIFVAVDGVCVGVVALSDRLRDTAADSVRKLHGMHAQTILLTGDTPTAAAYLAEKVGISAVKAGLLPAQKADAVARMRDSGKTV